MKPTTWALIAGVVVLGVLVMTKRRTQSPQERRSESGEGDGSRPLYNASRLTNEQQAMAELIRNEAESSGLNPAFMIALAVTESSLNPRAIGDDGLSFGLFQLNKNFHRYPESQLLDPIFNADTAMVEMLSLLRRFPGNSFNDYAEAWTLGGSGRFTKGRRNPVKRQTMQRAVDDLDLVLDLMEVPA